MNALDAEQLLERFAERLQRGGVRHPHVAAAVLAARGRARTDQVGFAASLRIRVGDLRRAEAGELALDQIPDRLRRALDVS